VEKKAAEGGEEKLMVGSEVRSQGEGEEESHCSFFSLSRVVPFQFYLIFVLKK
jgi:hypothetical protein